MATTVGVVIFPGTNCERDAVSSVERLGGTGRLLWHADEYLGDVDAVIVPGGFAHGDYLRPGAIARFSPVMGAVARFAADGGPVVGICNGFQVLTESGLLPGALQKNAGLKFLCQPTTLRVETTESVLTRRAEVGADCARTPGGQGCGLQARRRTVPDHVHGRARQRGDGCHARAEFPRAAEGTVASEDEGTVHPRVRRRQETGPVRQPGEAAVHLR